MVTVTMKWAIHDCKELPFDIYKPSETYLKHSISYNLCEVNVIGTSSNSDSN